MTSRTTEVERWPEREPGPAPGTRGAAQRRPQLYYVPHGSYWPILGSIGLTLLLVGFARVLTGAAAAQALMGAGAAFTLVMLFGWFGTVIGEGLAGRYNSQVDRSFRWGMGWFIFSEAMLFAALFGALFYARVLAVPWLGGAGAGASMHLVLWSGFEALWPLLAMPDPSGFDLPRQAMRPEGIPALNTLSLLSSSLTPTWAHWGLKRGQRRGLIAGIAVTLALGALFLALQAQEYVHAYRELNFKLSSGIYGSTFFLPTGFHGAHVTAGAAMLAVMLGRGIAGHFSVGRHFAFETASVTIQAPQDGAKLAAGEPVTLEYKVVPGPQGDHVHVYVDGGEVAILRELEGSYAVGPLTPGRHELAIKVVNRAHVPIGVESSVAVDVQ